MSEEKNEAIGFVTKKVLVTFTHQVALMINGSCIFAQAAICEYQETSDAHVSIPDQFTIVALPDGRKMTKSLHLHAGRYGVVAAMVELDGDE